MRAVAFEASEGPAPAASAPPTHAREGAVGAAPLVRVATGQLRPGPDRPPT